MLYKKFEKCLNFFVPLICLTYLRNKKYVVELDQIFKALDIMPWRTAHCVLTCIICLVLMMTFSWVLAVVSFKVTLS